MRRVLAFVASQDQAAFLKECFGTGAFGECAFTIVHLSSTGEPRSQGRDLHETFALSWEGVEAIEEDVLDWFERWVVGEHPWGNIRSLLLYRDVSLWFLVQAWFFGSLLLNDSALRNLLLGIGLAQAAFNRFNPDRVVIIDDGRPMGRAVALVAGSRGVPADWLSFGSLIERWTYAAWWRIKPSTLELLKLAKSLVRWIWFELIRRQPRPRGRVWLLSMSLGTDEFETLPDGTRRYRDYLIGAVVGVTSAKYGQGQVAVVEFDVTSHLKLSRLRHMRSPYYPFELFSGPKEILRAWRAAAGFRTQWRGLRLQESFRQSFSYQNVPFWHLVAPLCQTLYTWRLPEAIRYLDALDRAVNSLRPAVVMVSDEMSRFSCALATAAHRRQIPSINLQHGLFYVDRGYPGFVPALDERWGGEETGVRYVPQADYFAAYGQASKEYIMRRRSYPPDRIRTVGCPRYDALVSREARGVRDVCRARLSLSKEVPAILLISNLLFTDDSLRLIYTTVKRLQRAALLVRPHPREGSRTRYRRLARQIGLPIRMVSDIDLTDLLHGCDVVVAGASTVTVEAALIGKQVIVGAFGQPESFFSYAQGLPCVRTADELYMRLSEALSIGSKARPDRSAELETFLTKTFANHGGNASAAMLAELERIALRGPESK